MGLQRRPTSRRSKPLRAPASTSHPPRAERAQKDGHPRRWVSGDWETRSGSRDENLPGPDFTGQTNLRLFLQKPPFRRPVELGETQKGDGRSNGRSSSSGTTRVSKRKSQHIWTRLQTPCSNIWDVTPSRNYKYIPVPICQDTIGLASGGFRVSMTSQFGPHLSSPPCPSSSSLFHSDLQLPFRLHRLARSKQHDNIFHVLNLSLLEVF